MSSLFAFIRQDLRASLIASLLVLGHALLLTAVKAPQEARTPELTTALGTTSALISITILWVTFTILEALDARLFTRWSIRRSTEEEEEEDEGEVLVFCMTWVELALGLMMLAAWALYSPHALVIMDAFVAGRSMGLTLIKGSYITAMASLALLQLHLLLSIAWHALRHGGVASWAFWNGRTGWWVGMGRIRLAEERREAGEKV